MPAYTEDQLAVRLLAELEPVVTGEINRHITMAKDWYPHEYVPWSEGRDFDGVLGGEAWEPTEQRFSDAARAALIVNLLTEDNLPSYHREIAQPVRPGRRLGHVGAPLDRRGGPARHRHPRLPDGHPRGRPRRARASLRMAHMQTGLHRRLQPGMLDGLAYVSFQELATRVSHRNTGKATGDPSPSRCSPASPRTRTCT